MIRPFAAARSLVYAAGFVLLWGWIVVSVRPLDSRVPFTIADWLSVPGLAVAITGAAVVLWCIGAFVLVGKGTPAPFDAPREFVATGPYRYVRNPMYLGGALLIAGAGLVLRSPAAVLVAPCFLVFFHVFVFLYEEPTLERRFGESYRRYRASVNRWCPRRPRAAT